LLRRLGIDKPLVALHQYNERTASTAVLERLARGERIAYISDAGTPAISDPGAALVGYVRAAGHPAVPIPGASSVIAALSVSGDAHGNDFVFAGFLPARGRERALALERLAGTAGRVVLFEAPHRISALVEGLALHCPDRQVTVCRELTKQFETVATLPAKELPGWLAADETRRRGEFVVILHAITTRASDEDAASVLDHATDATLRTLLGALPLKQAVAIGAELTGAPRNTLYARALQLKQAPEDDEQSKSDRSDGRPTGPV
jgi:16S rRNA (cytidine1402-2'-O)-methyltransferase